MKSESVKKSLEKSKIVLDEKRKMNKRKICIKRPTRLQLYYELQEQLTTLEVNIYHFYDLKWKMAPVSAHFSFDF